MLTPLGLGVYHSMFVDKYFADLKRLKKNCVNVLESTIAKVSKRNDVVDENDKDVTRLILLEIFIIILFSNTRITISWDLDLHCEDLKKIKNYR